MQCCVPSIAHGHHPPGFDPGSVLARSSVIYVAESTERTGRPSLARMNHGYAAGSRSTHIFNRLANNISHHFNVILLPNAMYAVDGLSLRHGIPLRFQYVDRACGSEVDSGSMLA